MISSVKITDILLASFTSKTNIGIVQVFVWLHFNSNTKKVFGYALILGGILIRAEANVIFEKF